MKLNNFKIQGDLKNKTKPHTPKSDHLSKSLKMLHIKDKKQWREKEVLIREVGKSGSQLT